MVHGAWHMSHRTGYKHNKILLSGAKAEGKRRGCGVVTF